MFIELAEFLRCPELHEPDALCVLVPDEMIGRNVVLGSVGCPVCRREYPIVDGVADFTGESPLGSASRTTSESVPDPHVVQALLHLAGPGGYVVLVGGAAGVGAGLGELIGGVHFVAVNAPPEVEPTARMSMLRGRQRLPLKTGMARGVVVGADDATPTVLAEALRVSLRGLRIVVLRQDVTLPGAEPLTVGNGMWVGEKR